MGKRSCPPVQGPKLNYRMIKQLLALAVGFAATASAGSIKDIEHVVLFMQENRAFDHVC
jgi:phospholipase C